MTVAVVPFDDVGRLAIFMVNLENDAITIRLARPISSNQDSITNFCEHDASDPRAHYQLFMSLIATALGTEVPTLDTRQALTGSTRLCMVAFPRRRAPDSSESLLTYHRPEQPNVKVLIDKIGQLLEGLL